MLINQVIYTIQCEGPNLGKPSLLIRTQGCNLKCPWCDTKQSWGIKNSEKDKRFLDQRIREILQNYNCIRNIMITGGEPLNNKFDEIIEYIFKESILRNLKIEIETNGTLIKDNIKTLKKYKNRITMNLSPKLERDCHFDKDYDQIVELYHENIRIAKENKLNYNIKFVYDHSDMYSEDRINHFIIKNDIDKSNIYIMSLTQNNEFDLENCKKTIEFCKRKGFQFTPRLHLMIYGNDINENSV